MTDIPNNVQIILFDGVCNLCEGAIQFIIKKDVKRIFRFASLQSEIGKKLLSERNIDVTKVDSIVLIIPTEAYYVKSSAALNIAKKLKGIYPIFSAFLFFPKILRDPLYDFIAKNRYSWFGKKESCMVPSQELNELFLDK